MKKTPHLILSTALLAILVLGGFRCQLMNENVNEGEQVENTNENKNVNENVNSNRTTDWKTDKFDIKNGFCVSIPSGWVFEGGLDNAINTVKFGSPAQIISFNPEGHGDQTFLPFISTNTFTIDERLDAKDVANLIHDSKIAEKLEKGTKECLFNPEESILAGFNTFSYIHDNTDLSRCSGENTGVYISKTTVLKSPGNKHSAILTLTVSNSEEYEKFLPDFQFMLENLQYEEDIEVVNETSGVYDIPADWQKFTGEKLGYTIWYPKDWYTSNFYQQGLIQDYIANKDIPSPMEFLVDEEGAWITIEIIEKNNQSLDDIIDDRDNRWGLLVTDSSEEVTIDGYPARLLTQHVKEGAGTESGWYLNAYIDIGEKVFLLECLFHNPTSQDSLQNTVLQIINSFRYSPDIQNENNEEATREMYPSPISKEEAYQTILDTGMNPDEIVYFDLAPYDMTGQEDFESAWTAVVWVDDELRGTFVDALTGELLATLTPLHEGLKSHLVELGITD